MARAGAGRSGGLNAGGVVVGPRASAGGSQPAGGQGAGQAPGCSGLWGLLWELEELAKGFEVVPWLTTRNGVEDHVSMSAFGGLRAGSSQRVDPQ